MKIRSLLCFDLPAITCFLIFFISPYVDAVTGFLVNREVIGEGGAGSPSQIFRLFITLLMLVQIRDNRHWQIIILSLIWLFVIECLSLFMHTNIDWLILGIVYSYKLAFSIIVYCLIREYFCKGFLDFDRLQNLIVLMAVSYSIIIVVCDILGISSPSYPGADLGSKGPYAGGNDMGVFLGGASFVLLNKYLKEGGWKSFVFYIIMIKVMIGLMTKAGILFSIIGLLVLLFRQRKLVKISIFTFILIFILLYWNHIIKFIESAFGMIIWRIKRTDSIIDIVLGGREHYLTEMASYSYDNSLQIVKLILGGGYKLSFRDPNSFNYDPNGVFIIEADFFDVYFMYGVIGIILYLLVFLSGFRAKSTDGIYVLKLGWAVLFIHSSLAGHVVANGALLLLLPSMLMLLHKYKQRYN